MLDNLLGTPEAEPDRIRRCDIMFPEGEIRTFGMDWMCESGLVTEVNCGDLVSVGVGGVLTITGAGLWTDGGVCGRCVVSMVMVLPFPTCGLSGDDVVDLGLA